MPHALRLKMSLSLKYGQSWKCFLHRNYAFTWRFDSYTFNKVQVAFWREFCFNATAALADATSTTAGTSTNTTSNSTTTATTITAFNIRKTSATTATESISATTGTFTEFPLPLLLLLLLPSLSYTVEQVERSHLFLSGQRAIFMFIIM